MLRDARALDVLVVGSASQARAPQHEVLGEATGT